MSAVARPMTWRRLRSDAARLADAGWLAIFVASLVVLLLLPAAAGLAFEAAIPYLGDSLTVLILAGVVATAASVLAYIVPATYLVAATHKRLDPETGPAPGESVRRRTLPAVGTALLVGGAVAALAGIYFGAIADAGIIVRVVATIVAVALVFFVALFSTLAIPHAVVDGLGPWRAYRASASRVAGREWRLLAMILALCVLPGALVGLALDRFDPGNAWARSAGAGLSGALFLVLATILHHQATWRPPPAPRGEHLVQARDLVRWFPIRGGVLGRTKTHVRAVDGVGLRIRRGTTLGLVGESGCGKTTVGRTIVRLIDATGGSITYDGEDVTTLDGPELRELRQKVQIVFQDPMSSLNPRMTVRQLLREPLRFAAKVPRKEIDRRVEQALERVGLKASHADRYPHEFSGGQRQRIGIARALAPGPEFIVLDEPTSALDVSVQAQILNLLRELQQELDLTYLFISHDLSVIRHLCDEIAVMYLGRIVEQGPVEEVFRNPQHPYTQALLAAVPVPDPDVVPQRIILTGDVPSPVNPPAACRFHPRCPRAQQICSEVDPPLEEKRPGQIAACHFPGPQSRWPVTQPTKVRE